MSDMKKSLSTTVPSGTKMPKSKLMPDPFGKPSKFFKNEDQNGSNKGLSIDNLRAFLEKKKLKRQSLKQ